MPNLSEALRDAVETFPREFHVLLLLILELPAEERDHAIGLLYSACNSLVEVRKDPAALAHVAEELRRLTGAP